MLDRLIGKNVEITVAFATSTNQSGPIPMAYYGVLKEVGNEYCVVSLSYKRPLCFMYDPLKMAPKVDLGERCSGDIYIKKEFIVTCYELP